MSHVNYEPNKTNLKYIPERNLLGPRWVVLLLSSTFFLGVLVIVSYLGIERILGYNPFFFQQEGFNWGLIFYCWLLFYCYKVAVTHTVVDEVSINYETRRILFKYWYFYFKLVVKEIDFQNFSFRTNDDSLFFGNSASIRIYENNKPKIKLNPKNGWKKEQIDQILTVFFEITDGKTRTVRWQL